MSLSHLPSVVRYLLSVNIKRIPSRHRVWVCDTLIVPRPPIRHLMGKALPAEKQIRPAACGDLPDFAVIVLAA